MNIITRKSKRNGIVINRLVTVDGFGFTSRRTKNTVTSINWKNWVDQSSEIATEIYTAENNSPEIIGKWWEN